MFSDIYSTHPAYVHVIFRTRISRRRPKKVFVFICLTMMRLEFFFPVLIVGLRWIKLFLTRGYTCMCVRKNNSLTLFIKRKNCVFLTLTPSHHSSIVTFSSQPFIAWFMKNHCYHWNRYKLNES